MELKGGEDYCSLKDLFEDKFLVEFNLRGGFGRKSFTDLDIYKEIYVCEYPNDNINKLHLNFSSYFWIDLLKKNGVPEKKVQKIAAENLRKLKNKIQKRNSYHINKRSGGVVETRFSLKQLELDEYEDSQSQVSFVESKPNIEEFKLEEDSSIQIDDSDKVINDNTMPDIQVLLDSKVKPNENLEQVELIQGDNDDDDMEEAELIQEIDMDNFFAEEEAEKVEQDEQLDDYSDLSYCYSTFPNEFTFKPINSDRDLKYVTKLMNINQAYLQFLVSSI